MPKSRYNVLKCSRVCKCPPLTLAFPVLLFVTQLSCWADTCAAQIPSLSQAILTEDVQAIRQTIAGDLKLLEQPVSRRRGLPLRFAIQNERAESVRVLLELGADPTSGTPRQYPLEIAFAVRDKAARDSILKHLLDRLPNPDQAVTEGRSAIGVACGYRQTTVALLQRLVAQGADTNLADSRNQTPLLVACYYGRVDLAEFLVQQGANVQAVDADLNSILHAACAMKTSPAILDFALQHFPDASAKNKQGQTPLHLLVGTRRADLLGKIIDRTSELDAMDQRSITPLATAVRNRDAKSVEVLLSRGADPKHYDNSAAYRVPPLICSAANAGDAEVARLLLAAGANVNVAGERGSTPLHLAARLGGTILNRRMGRGGMRPGEQSTSPVEPYLKTIAQMLQAGADANVVDEDNRLPIELAARSEFVEAVGLLLPRTMRLDLKFGPQPLIHWAAERGQTELVARLLSANTEAVSTVNAAGETPLQIAVKANQFEAVKQLIVAGANVDQADSSGLSPFLLAASAGHRDVVAILLQAGADVHQVDSSGQNALHLAAWNGALGVVEELTQSIPKAAWATSSGYTPLHAAAWKGHVDVVARLLEAGADANAVDADGWSPLHKAAFRGHHLVVSRLLAAGAIPKLANEVGMTARDLAVANQHQAIAELLK